MITQQNNFVNEFYKGQPVDKFAKHKKYAIGIQEKLASIFTDKRTHELNEKGQRIIQCGSNLTFERFKDEDKTTTLSNANFCKHKLCPFCAWRWHIKNSAILQEAFNQLQGKKFYHLVLTIPNINFLTKDFLITLRQNSTKFLTKIIKTKDYFSSLEITIDKNKKFHPHFHIVLIADKIPTKKEIQTQWAKISNCGNDYAICDIKPCTNSKVSMELTKYILKFDDIELDEKTLFIIEKATKGIRKFATSGIIKKAEEQAKNIIQQQAFEKMQTLQEYDSELLFYEWIAGAYNLKQVLDNKHKQHF